MHIENACALRRLRWLLRARLAAVVSVVGTLLLTLLVTASTPAHAWEEIRGPVLATAPDEVREGSAFFVTIRSAEPLPVVEVDWLGRTLTLRALPRSVHGVDGGRRTVHVAQALLGVGLVSRDTELSQRLPDDFDGVHFPLVIRAVGFEEDVVMRHAVRRVPGRFPEQRLAVARRFTELSAETLARHIVEKAAVEEALSAFTPECFWDCPLRLPTPGDVSSPFGLRRFFNDEPRKAHTGVDLRAPLGEPVRACWSGVARLTGSHYFAGGSVYVDHGQGVVSMYFHLSEIMIREGQRVSPGEVLGRVGATGRVTGPHLHFGLAIMGHRVDPMPLTRPGCGLPEND